MKPWSSLRLLNTWSLACAASSVTCLSHAADEPSASIATLSRSATHVSRNDDDLTIIRCYDDGSFEQFERLDPDRPEQRTKMAGRAMRRA